MKNKFYFGVTPDEIVLAVGEQAGISLEDTHTVLGPYDERVTIKNIFREVYKNDKKRILKHGS